MTPAFNKLPSRAIKGMHQIRFKAAFVCVLNLIVACRPNDLEVHRKVSIKADFVPFGLCMANMSPADQVAYCRKIGFSGLGISAMTQDLLHGFAILPEVKSHAFRIPSVLWWSPVNEKVDTVWLDTLLKDAHAMNTAIWMVAIGKKSDPNALHNAIEKYEIVARHCDAAGVRLVLYPHYGSIIETVEESLPVLDSLRRRGQNNVKTSIHLCHELKFGNGRRIGEIVNKSAPYLAFATVSGASGNVLSFRMGGWENVIQPLDKGDFDIRPFLQALAQNGFQGTIELHTYGLSSPADAKYDQHLERSLKTWNKVVEDGVH